MKRWYAAVEPEALHVSVLVVGEVRRGIERLRRRDPQQARELLSPWHGNCKNYAVTLATSGKVARHGRFSRVALRACDTPNIIHEKANTDNDYPCLRNHKKKAATKRVIPQTGVSSPTSAQSPSMPQPPRLKHLFRLFRRPPAVFYHGQDLEEDLKRRGLAPSLIFDVGANVGQTARRLARAFPHAAIHAFEPFSKTYAELCRRVGQDPRIQTHCSAFGAEPDKRVVQLQGSLINSLKTSEKQFSPDTPSDTITVDTVDAFCERHEIETIDFLKIDTEGYDLNVIKGANRLLEAQHINLVQVEAGMTPHNHKHVPLTEFLSFLEPRGYQLLGLYDQTPEWSGELRLRFCNPVFISTHYMDSVGRFPLRGVNGDGFRWR